MTPVLTVTMPTYDRPTDLRRNLPLILPQLDSRCRLLILDNASPQPAAEAVADLLPADLPCRPRVVRHAANVGASANVLRCFEFAETEWVWILCDDDAARPDAVATIFRTIEQYPNAAYVSYPSMGVTRSETRSVVGLPSLLASEPDFALLIFLSSSIYRRSALLSLLRVGYHYAGTLAPQLAILLSLARDGAECVLANEAVVDWEEPDASQRWSRLNFALGMATLADLPLPYAQRMEVLRMLERTCGTLGQHLAQLLGNPAFAVDDAGGRHLFDQVWHRLYPASHSGRNWAVRCLGRLLLRFPRLGAKLLAWRQGVPRHREQFLNRS